MLTTLKKKAALSLASLGLVLGGSILGTPPAQAFVWDNACNSSGSDETVVFKNYNAGYSTEAYPGWCYPNTFGDGTNMIVDVDATGSASRGVDVDSYKIGWIDHGYGTCHVGETDASNPPDNYENPGVRYFNSTGTNCA
jgi:hypothetical protein